MLLGANGELEHHRPSPQPVLNHSHHAEKVGPHPIHLIDEGDAGNPVFVRLTPHRLRLGLNPSDRTKNRNSPIENPERTLDLDGEVHMAGGVDDVDPMVAPQACGGRRGDRYAPLLLLDHPVHGGSPFIHLTDLVVDPRIVKDPLGRGGLSRINMGHDADIAGLI